MAPTIKIQLEPGSLRVSFAEGPNPSISSIASDSPLRGKVQIGCEFSQLSRSNGNVIENLDSEELVDAPQESSNDRERVLKMVMSFPHSCDP